MGRKATISFGIVIAHHSVPLAIALENLWQAEAEAKEHHSPDLQIAAKDAVQVRVLYGNGNMLAATAKFDILNRWRSLLNCKITAEASLTVALFEQAAYVWGQHPAPVPEAIGVWVQAFCDRRDLFDGEDNAKGKFQDHLKEFLVAIWQTTPPQECDRAIENWLKLAAFVLRNRQIKLGVA
ncbi:MAG: hypothetical protein N4J56_001665 [Chroococcidiopsis sp. SAG 2025]|nr:hypothetical protein [Chroococcidiopsis sp. SAG 2025]MDV2992011.1 hypothetical protein [Chroococcidiopsis sp. SAG 2025]